MKKYHPASTWVSVFVLPFFRFSEPDSVYVKFDQSCLIVWAPLAHFNPPGSTTTSLVSTLSSIILPRLPWFYLLYQHIDSPTDLSLDPALVPWTQPCIPCMNLLFHQRHTEWRPDSVLTWPLLRSCPSVALKDLLWATGTVHKYLWKSNASAKRADSGHLYFWVLGPWVTVGIWPMLCTIFTEKLICLKNSVNNSKEGTSHLKPIHTPKIMPLHIPGTDALF